MKRILLALPLLSLFPWSASAAGMRCGTHLVQEGYDFTRVEQLCGEPDSAYSLGERYIYNSVRNSSQAATIAQVIRLDQWVYRQHQNGFSRILHFENGRLVSIELGDRN